MSRISKRINPLSKKPLKAKKAAKKAKKPVAKKAKKPVAKKAKKPVAKKAKKAAPAKAAKKAAKKATKKSPVKAAAKKAVKKLAAKPVKKLAAKAAVKKAPAKKAGAKRVAPRKPAATKKAAPRKVAAVKKAAPRKAVAKKATPRSAPIKLITPPPAKLRYDGASADQVNTILTVLEDAKAENTVAIDLEGRSTMADAMVVTTGRVNRHVAAIADQLLGKLKDNGVKNIRVEGLEAGDWCLVDTGDVIIHIFRPEVRAFYNLEKLWSLDAPKEQH